VVDQDVCYNFLQEVDFGFVYKILSYSRLHTRSATSANSAINRVLRRSNALMEYGKCYLSNEEYEERLAQRLNNYYAFLAQSVQTRRKDFWKYHAQGLDRLGRFSWLNWSTNIQKRFTDSSVWF
jgi:hypothetical protein